MDNFYSQLADDYDSMTRFDSRLEGMRRTLEPLVTDGPIRVALDVACGTGIATLALAQLGVDATGTDLNPDMINGAKKNAAKYDVPQLKFELAGMGEPFSEIRSDYDAVFCLGNSIPHVLDAAMFEATCIHFYNILRPGGKLIIQLKNFEMLLINGERYVGAHRDGDREYVRFYDFAEDTVNFNILRLDWDNTTAVKHDLISTTLKTYQRRDFENALRSFSTLEFYSTLTFEPFEPLASSDLVVVATR